MKDKENKRVDLGNARVLKESTLGGRRMRLPITKKSPSEPSSDKPRNSGKTNK